MIINKKSIQLLAISALFFASSCKKDLNLNPTDSFTEDKAYQTMDDVQYGVNTCYARMGAYSSDLYSSALVSDEGKLGPDNSGQGALTYRYQYNSDGTTGGDLVGAWSSYYSVLHQVNTVLPFIDKVSGDPARKSELKGQLLGLRAICHFYLMQSYAGRYNATAMGVPYIDYVNIFAQPARNTMGDVMTKIEADMTTAQSLLSSSTVFSDTVINKINLTAYQAKIALYKGDYQKAIDYATTVINSNVKPLATGTAFTNIWQDASTSELLFRIRYGTSSAIGSMWTTVTNDVYVTASDKLNAAFYSTNDVRKATYIGTVAGKRFVKKYEKSSRGGRIVDLKVMRIPEMYLIRAEAYAKIATPNLQAGTDDINALKSKRITGYTNIPAVGSSQALVDSAMNERFRELCFEGFRIFDLKRNNMDVQRLGSDAGSAWQTLTKDNFRFVFPIPNDEILANKNMVQNPGY